MRFAFIEQHAAHLPGAPHGAACSRSPPAATTLGGRVPRARGRPSTATLVGEIRRVHARHQGRYGSPRMHAALRVEGHRCSRSRVERLMRRHRHPRAGRAPLPALHHRQPPSPPGGAEPAGTALQAPAPNRVWLADMTYIPTGEGWLYLAAVLDLPPARWSAGRCGITCRSRAHPRGSRHGDAAQPPPGRLLHHQRPRQPVRGRGLSPRSSRALARWLP